MSRNASYDARGLFFKFKRLEAAAQAGVKAVVRDTSHAVAADIRKMLDRPVGKSQKGQKIRSRPGQPPRSDTGRERRSINVKTSPKGWVGTVSTDDTASDTKGRRYPWMLESGTKTIKKRPLFKKAQRNAKKGFQRAMAKAVVAAVRKGNSQ